MYCENIRNRFSSGPGCESKRPQRSLSTFTFLCYSDAKRLGKGLCPPCSGYLLALSHSLPFNRDRDEGDEGNEGAESEEMPKLPEVWVECDEHPR